MQKKFDGSQIIQVYVRKLNDTAGPLKSLRGFKRVEIPVGKTLQVSIDLNPSAFEFFDWEQQKMAVTLGEYEVFYGTSLDDKSLKKVKVAIQ